MAQRETEWFLYDKGEFEDTTEEFANEFYTRSLFELLFVKRENRYNRFFLKQLVKFYRENMEEQGINGLILRVQHLKHNLKKVDIWYQRKY
jgi:hypothetical protein